MAAFGSVVSLVIFSFLITFTHQLSLRLDQYPPSAEVSSHIEPADPDPECPEKEIWSWFRAHCGKNCSNYDKIIPCPRISVPGCVCEEGLVRGTDDKCIPPTSCPPRSEEEPSRTHWAEWASSDEDPKCPQNEEWSWCLAHCQKNCTNFDKLIPCPKICVPGCVCKKEYVRGPDDKCIEQSSCPQRSEEVSRQIMRADDDCPEHEHSDWCYAHCQKDCTNYAKDIPCPQMCVPGCVCDEGYVRGHDGSCVAISSCAAKSVERIAMRADDECPENEHSDWCYAHCQKDCTNYDKDISCPQMCVPGCVCDEGYVRGHDGSCVSISSCPAKSVESTEVHSCPPKMEYSPCLAHCQRNCSNWSKPHLPCPKMCVPGCVCQRGLVKDESGQCIDPRKCTPATEQMSELDSDMGCLTDEQYNSCDAYPPCQRVCANYDKRIICPVTCYPGCICKQGYVRGANGKCMQISKCPSHNDIHSIQDGFRLCAENEKFSTCDAYPTCQRHCSDSGKPCPDICYPGCICNEGYVRKSDGRCVEISECTKETESMLESSTSCAENQDFSSCGAHPDCQRHCNNSDEPIICSNVCYSGCICKRGYVIGDDGKCIESSTCPSKMSAFGDLLPIPVICRRDEVFSVCASSCPDDCDNYKDTGRKCNFICLPGCTCKSGTVRGPDGKCIRPNQCPSDKKPEDCTEFEYYDTCGTACPDNCTNYGKDERTCDKRCVIGCFCLPGYVRGPRGDCIFPFECPTGSPSQMYTSSPQESSSSQVYMSSSTEEFRSEQVYTSSPDAEKHQAYFTTGCPDEDACTAECQKIGRRYGVCSGTRNRTCTCY